MKCSLSPMKSLECTPADSWFYTLTILDSDSDQQAEIEHPLLCWSLLVTQPIKKKIYCTQTHSKFYFGLLKERSGSLFWDVYKGNITGLHTSVSKNFNKGYQFRILRCFYNRAASQTPLNHMKFKFWSLSTNLPKLIKSTRADFQLGVAEACLMTDLNIWQRFLKLFLKKDHNPRST